MECLEFIHFKIEIFILTRKEKRNIFPCVPFWSEFTSSQEYDPEPSEWQSILQTAVKVLHFVFPFHIFLTWKHQPTGVLLSSHRMTFTANQNFTIYKIFMPQNGALNISRLKLTSELQEIGAEATAIQISLSWDWGIRPGKYNFLTA